MRNSPRMLRPRIRAVKAANNMSRPSATNAAPRVAIIKPPRADEVNAEEPLRDKPCGRPGDESGACVARQLEPRRAIRVRPRKQLGITQHRRGVNDAGRQRPKENRRKQGGEQRDRHLGRSRDPDTASLGHRVDDDQGKNRPRIAAERVPSEQQTNAERGSRDAESQGVELSLSLYSAYHLPIPLKGYTIRRAVSPQC